MTKQYIPAVVSIDFTDYAYPCFHQCDIWNGWAMPYFRFEHAQQVALEFKVRYDKENDTFVLDDNGEADVYTPFLSILKAKL